jgi:hypothetical protein
MKHFPTYGAAANSKGTVLVGDPNARLVLAQFNTELLQTGGMRGPIDDYYDSLYGTRPGYWRPKDFWEIPQWIACTTHSFPDAAMMVIRDPLEAVTWLRDNPGRTIGFSLLDVNSTHVVNMARAVPSQRFVVGGASNVAQLWPGNVERHGTIADFAAREGRAYRDGYDYRLFHGTQTIPRLELSTGCRHKCSFCTIEKDIKVAPSAQISQQVDSMARHLNFKLIYLNDKTFGQASNYGSLAAIHAFVRAKTSGFDGFIVQTTATELVKTLSPEFLRRSGIRYVEIGVESFNDPILRAVHKPATEKLINEAAMILRKAKVPMIPNIMVGLPGETPATYARTLKWLQMNSDIISHVNVYSTALYEGTELAAKIAPFGPEDIDENRIDKSFRPNPSVDIAFHRAVVSFAHGRLRWFRFKRIGGTALSLGAAFYLYTKLAEGA